MILGSKCYLLVQMSLKTAQVTAEEQIKDLNIRLVLLFSIREAFALYN